MQSCHSYLAVLTECDNKEIVCTVVKETAGRKIKKSSQEIYLINIPQDENFCMEHRLHIIISVFSQPWMIKHV